MKYLLRTIGAAMFGSTLGYVAHQAMRRNNVPAGTEHQLVVGAPALTSGIAALVGLFFGKRGSVVAFAAGLGLAGAFGDQLDAKIPGLASAKQRLIDKASDLRK